MAASVSSTQTPSSSNFDASGTTDDAVGTIDANAQQQLLIAKAQANASLMQALGEAFKSGASSISKAAQAS